MKEAWKAVGQFFKTADIFLLVVCLLASGFGLVLISSAGRTMEVGAQRLLMVQGGAIAVGVILFVILSSIPLDMLSRLWPWILAFDVLVISLLLVWGVERGGNRSWLEIPHFPVAIQPAEVAKIGFIIVLAKQITAFDQRERLNHILPVGLLAGHFGLMAGVIFVTSKDIGMIVVFSFIFLAMCLAGGLKLRWFAVAGALVAGATPLIWRAIGEVQRQRILIGFKPELDPLKYGWQALQSKLAIGGGKLTGQGLYKGVQSQLGTLPEKQTDFIFAVAGEELGLVGCMGILLLLSIIIVRCLYISTQAKTDIARLICVGVAGMTLCQTVINVGMCLALTPVIGLTLPFFSYGGSSIVTMFAAMGLVSSARRHPKTHWLRD